MEIDMNLSRCCSQQRNFKSANITTIKDLKQNIMTINEKVENLSGEINVKEEPRDITNKRY